MERKVGKFETAPTLANEYASFNLIGVLKIENAPSTEVIQQSLDMLQNHHPALQTRLEKRGNARYFRSIHGRQTPLEVHARNDEDHWRTVVEHNLNTSLDWRAGPLLACTFLQGEGTSELVFAFHHAIVDAVSLVSFFDDFLNLCAANQAGEEPEGFNGYPALPPVEALFPPRFHGLRMRLRTFRFMLQQMASEMSIMRKTRGKRKPPVRMDTTGKVLTMTLSEEITTALQKKARRHKVTLNSTQHAAMLLAAWQHLYQSEPRPLKYILFQNLRPYLSPPVDRKVLGSYIAMIQLAINMHPERGFWELCKEINQAVYQTGKSGDKFISANMSGSLIKMLFRFKTFRMAATALNYSGSVSLPEHYGSIRLVNVRGFASNFGLGPEFTAQTLIFRGELLWNIVYLDTDMNEQTAQMIADSIHRILAEKAREG